MHVLFLDCTVGMVVISNAGFYAGELTDVMADCRGSNMTNRQSKMELGKGFRRREVKEDESFLFPTLATSNRMHYSGCFSMLLQLEAGLQPTSTSYTICLA